MWRRAAIIREMSVKAVIGFSAGILIAVSCATRQYAGQFEEAIKPPAPRPYVILEHKNASGEMPLWLRGYLDKDEQLVETLPDYADYYIFVLNEKSSGFTTLSKWSDYFRIEQDFSHAVFLRVYKRLLAESEGRPDYYMGDFFEIFLKKIAGHAFHGASREDDYWLKVSFEQESAEATEEYRYYILSKINKNVFQEEIMELFAAAHSEVTPDKLQAGVISRLQSTLFSGF
jgi:hypothetical protein